MSTPCCGSWWSSWWSGASCGSYDLDLGKRKDHLPALLEKVPFAFHNPALEVPRQDEKEVRLHPPCLSFGHDRDVRPRCHAADLAGIDIADRRNHLVTQPTDLAQDVPLG